MLKITITGTTKSGKTTMALALWDFLHRNGFISVECRDPDVVPGLVRPHHDKCMEAIAIQDVLIETEQVNVR